MNIIVNKICHNHDIMNISNFGEDTVYTVSNICMLTYITCGPQLIYTYVEIYLLGAEKIMMTENLL